MSVDRRNFDVLLNFKCAQSGCTEVYPQTTLYQICLCVVSGIQNVLIIFLGSKVQTDNLVTAVDIEEGQIKVTNSSGNSLCDGLILTMPVPQILSLKGNISELIGNVRGILMNIL